MIDEFIKLRLVYLARAESFVRLKKESVKVLEESYVQYCDHGSDLSEKEK